MHERTAEAIESLFQDNLDEHFSELAHHYSHSSNTLKAIEYFQRAGEQAMQHSANEESIGHLSRALSLLQNLPASSSRDRVELSLQLSLGPVWMVTKGYASAEVEATYTRALKLSRSVGETPQILSVLVGLRRLYALKAEYRTAYELARQLLKLAKRARDPELLVEAYCALAVTLFFMGEMGMTRRRLERALALYDRKRHQALKVVRYALDPRILSLSYLGWTEWHLGHPDEALKRSQEAITIAREIDHPFSLAHALVFDAELHLFRGEKHLTQVQAESAIALSLEHRFPHYFAWGTILRGWALAEEG